MNPISLVLIGLGLILLYIGWKGSQHNVLGSLTGKQPTTTTPASGASQPTATKAATPTTKTSTQTAGG